MFQVKFPMSHTEVHTIPNEAVTVLTQLGTTMPNNLWFFHMEHMRKSGKMMLNHWI
jgi:hypothetical protein